MDCCGIDTVSGAPGGRGSAGVIELRELEIDFTANGSRAFATGAEVVQTTDGDNITLTTLVTVNDTLTLTAGTGLVWDEGTTSATWSSTTRTATSILTPLSSIHSLLDIDSSWEIRIDAFFSVLSLLNAEFLVTGLDGVASTPANASSRLSGSGRARQAATQVWRPALNTGGDNYTSAPGPTTNVSGVVARSNAISAIAGTWSGSWATLRVPIQWGCVQTGTTFPMFDQNTRVLWAAFASNGVVGTSGATLERVRVQATSFAA